MADWCGFMEFYFVSSVHRAVKEKKDLGRKVERGVFGELAQTRRNRGQPDPLLAIAHLGGEPRAVSVIPVLILHLSTLWVVNLSFVLSSVTQP
jgi:hypothetical protein